jgi:hypothetical protein
MGDKLNNALVAVLALTFLAGGWVMLDAMCAMMYGAGQCLLF